MTPSAVTALNTAPAPPPGIPLATASTPASSTTCPGGSASSTSITMPQTGPIGRQARVVSTTSGVQGPAATSTASAGRLNPAAITPRARPEPTHGHASSCSRITAPSACARRANARVAAAGRTG